MTDATPPDRAALEAGQLARLRALLTKLVESNAFYAPRLRAAGLEGGVESLAAFRERMPFTTKDELVADQRDHPPYGTNLAFPLNRYTRFHQTSATSGAPLRWLDTPESWAALLECWDLVLAAAGVRAGDRVFFAFSFGPFLGFWTAFEAAARRGCLCIPGGGMSSAARARALFDNAAGVLCCTPTYALRLAEAIAEERLDPTRSPVRTIIVAGEPGGSVPAVRAEIERRWPGARVFDHHGMTEVGPVSYENPHRPGFLHVIENDYLAEVIDPAGGATAPPGTVGELVLTTLRRTGSPLLRYRTGDLVHLATASAEELGRADLALDGGILGRVDDMVLVRGVNVYPSAVDNIVRGQDGVAEYRVELSESAGLTQMRLVIEPAAASGVEGAGADRHAELCAGLERSLRTALNLRVPVAVADTPLPRFEMKAKRWVRVTADSR